MKCEMIKRVRGSISFCPYNPPTTVSTAKRRVRKTTSIRMLFLRLKRNRAKSMQNKHLLWTRLCFQCGLQPPNKSHGQFPERLGTTNTSSFFTKDKCFWRGPCPSALTVNMRVSGSNVTFNWWGTSGIKGPTRQPQRRSEGGKQLYADTQTCPLARTVHTHKGQKLLKRRTAKLYLLYGLIYTAWLNSHVIMVRQCAESKTTC